MMRFKRGVPVLGLVWIASLMASSPSLAQDDDTEVVRARAYIALADELYSLAEGYADELVRIFAKRSSGAGAYTPGTPADPIPITGTGTTYTDEELRTIEKYNAVVEEAKQNYEKLFGADYSFAGTDPMVLPINFTYLKREAYFKWSILQQGFLSGGHRVRGANLYAVNADFKKDLLERTGQIVEEVRRLDEEARRLRNDYNAIKRARVDENGALVGIDESRLQAQNYSLDTQSQIRQYQGQMESLDLQQGSESEDIIAKTKILYPAQDLFQRRWTSLMNVKATGGTSDFVTVQANWNYEDAKTNAITGSFPPGSYLLIRASGKWVPKGIISGGAVHPVTSIPPKNYFGFFGIRYGDLGQINFGLNEYDALVAQQLQSGALDADANGLSITTQESVTEAVERTRTDSSSVSVGAQASAGFSLFGNGVTVTASASTGHTDETRNSKGRSKSQGVTTGYKIANADMPTAVVGSLIAFVDWPGRNPADVQPIFVGSSGMIQIPNDAPPTDVVLYLMQNDAAGHHGQSTGSVNVEISTTSSFASYMPTFVNWLERGCNNSNADGTEVSDCGFKAILDKVAFQKDPQTFARSALNVFLQSVNPPGPFAKYISDIVEASVSLEMANRELELAIQRSEQTKISAMTARSAYEASQDKAQVTEELVESIQRRADYATQKGPLLAAAVRYYEDEIANVEVLRSHVLARLKRYLGLTIDSFNYLYLTDFKIQGEATVGFEGDFYKQKLDILVDQITNIDVQDDLLNPNRGYLVQDLSAEQVAELKAKGTTGLVLKPEDFFCKGYGIEDQVRVHIEKVGYLLDIDPINEQRFFKNPNTRRVAIRTTHSNSNVHYDLFGNVIEYYLPSQTKDIYGYSQRVLTDYHSDYVELGLSNAFQRASFRNTSYASSWILELLDRQSFDLSYLNGVKFVIYFTSTEARDGKTLQNCTAAPIGRGVQRGSWTP